jgi:surface protein
VYAWATDKATATAEYGPIGDWDVSAATSMGGLFSNYPAFNDDISKWNTARVADMVSMFQYTTAFNQNISGWNTASVTDMSYMFRFATAFNRNVASWNTASVSNMGSMFQQATAFDQNIAGWNVARVTNMGNMFNLIDSTTTMALSNCSKGAMYFAWGATLQAAQPDFAQYACTVGSFCIACITDGTIHRVVRHWMTEPAIASAENGGPIGDWNVVVVSNMASLFASNATFTADLSEWNVASVANMASMFDGATAFNQDISGWNTARVANMFQMFYGARAFNVDVLAWNVVKVRDFAGRAPSVRHSVFRSLRRRNGSRLASLSASVGAFRSNVRCVQPRRRLGRLQPAAALPGMGYDSANRLPHVERQLPRLQVDPLACRHPR